MNIAFAGFRHYHVSTLYEEARDNAEINILGAWEESEEGRGMAAPLGVDFCYPTLEALLGDDRVEIVILGGYYGQRGAHAIAALKAGKHVYADKPLCTSIKEIEEIEKLSKATGLKVGCMFTLRLNSGMKTVHDIVRSGKLGEVGAINLTAQHMLSYGSRPSWYYEEGKHGGVINDIAIHGIDIVEFITGLELKRVVAARAWNHFAKQEPQFKDCGQFMVELSNGAGFTGDVSYAAPNSCGFKLPSYWRMTIWGTKGVIESKMNGASVELALDGDDGMHEIEAESYDTNCIAEFLKEIAGEDTIITTAEVIRSTRDALTMQAAVK